MLKATEKFKNLLIKKREKENKIRSKSYTKNKKNKMKLIKFLKSNLPEKLENPKKNSFLIKNTKTGKKLNYHLNAFFKKNNIINKRKNYKKYSIEQFEKLSTIGKYNNKLLNKSGNFIIKIKNKNFQRKKIDGNFLKKEKDFIFYEIKKKINKFVFFKKIIFPDKIKKISLKINFDIKNFPIIVEMNPWYLKTNSQIFFNEENYFFNEFNILKYKIQPEKNFINNFEIKFLIINIFVLNSEKFDLSINFYNPDKFSKKNNFSFNEKIFLENEKKIINFKKESKENLLNRTNYIKYNKKHMLHKSEKKIKINSFFIKNSKKILRVKKKKKYIDDFNNYKNRINQYRMYIKLNNQFLKNKKNIFIYKKIFFIKSWFLIIYFLKYFKNFDKEVFSLKSENVYKNTILRLLTKIQIYLKNNFLRKLKEKKKKNK